MKVSIITIVDNTNFGTYLQALATSLAINKLGHEAEVIRYTRKCMTPKGMSMAILKDRGILRWFNRCVLHSAKKILELRELDYKFLSSFVPVTQEYIGYESLLSNPPIADVYLTGSDQVWNSVYNRGIDKSFYLDFAPKGKKRVSYAASIGMQEFPAKEVDETKVLLSKYQHITVRETSAKSILSKLGLGSDVVLDPTLLLNKKDWTAIANKYSFDYKDPYLLTYSVEYGNEDSYIKYYAQQIARKNNLKIYHVSYSRGGMMPDYVDKAFPLATPDLFLNLMLHASFVVVSSFHGTAFAVNFNKQFLTISPHRFNSRIESLLELLDLKQRIIKDDKQNLATVGSIDYDRINRILDQERVKSMNRFRYIIEE